jgi:hypothetical protein
VAALEQVRALVVADLVKLIEDLQELGESFASAAVWTAGWWLRELTIAVVEAVAIAADRVGRGPA